LRSDGLVTEALLRTAMSNRFETARPRPMSCVMIFFSFSFFAAKVLYGRRWMVWAIQARLACFFVLLNSCSDK
jgi:hypothetical protein